MFSNKRTHCRKTAKGAPKNPAAPSGYTVSVRTQFMLWFTTLFVGVAAATIIFVGHNLHQLLLRRIDQQLEELFSACRKDYIAGKNAAHLGLEISVGDLPADLITTFDRHLPGFVPLIACEPAAADPTSSPSVFGHVDEKIYLVRRSGTGKIYSRLLNVRPNIHLLRRRLLQKQKSSGGSLFFRVTDPEGKTACGSSNFPAGLSGPQSELPTTSGNARILSYGFPDGTVLTAGRMLTELHTRVEHYVTDLLAIGLPILGVGILVAWVISSRITSGIRRVGEAASDIAGGNYSRRVAGHYHGREIAELVSAFNTMSANTERLLNELRGATDDVAHDLKTPLTRIRGLAEVTAAGPKDFSMWTDTLGTIAEECDDMVAIINTMLEITRTESNIEYLKKEPVNLNGLLHRLYDLYLPAAEENDLAWNLETPPHAVVIAADRIKIQRMIGNLLDNALKFVPSGGRIIIRLEADEKTVRLHIIDNGPGIPDRDKKRIFERFVRLDSSRTRRGNGLGLAMVRAVARIHGGSAEITDTPGGGATFTITLARDPQNNDAGRASSSSPCAPPQENRGSGTVKKEEIPC